MSKGVIELFGISTARTDEDWSQLVEQQHCPYLGRTCLKIRKSQPDIAIGTCAVQYGVKQPMDIVICPHRFLGRGQIFVDCLHLLTQHEPGNEIHRVAEVQIPGGNVDYFLVSVLDGKVVDFVGIELQSLDTTGSVWGYRQQFLNTIGVDAGEVTSIKPYGMNWKMTAKTILMQMHHKVETFEHLGKHLVLVLQDVLLDYMRREFVFNHMTNAKLGHAMHFHAYQFADDGQNHKLQLNSRISTNADGMALALGLQANANVALDAIVQLLESKISEQTLLRL